MALLSGRTPQNLLLGRRVGVTAANEVGARRSTKKQTPKCIYP